MIPRLAATFFTVIALAACTSEDPPQESPIRNVLIISLDTLRADRLSIHGYDKPTSPFLDELAQDAFVFENARCQAPQTAPSHASLLTSLPPSAHGIKNAKIKTAEVRKLPPAATTLAEVARDAGIETAAFVSGGNFTRKWGADRGFDQWNEDLEEFDARIDAALEWILDPERGPFLAILHTYDVHAPYLPPADLVASFTDPKYQGVIRERLAVYQAMPMKEAFRRAMKEGYWHDRHLFSEEDVAFLSGLYDAEIAAMDAQLRRLFDALEAAGRLKDTLVVITSDHGEEFREHGKFAHDQEFDELLRVPLVLRFPDGHPLRAGRVAANTALLDVGPTIAELADLDAGDARWTGRSLVPLMHGDANTAAEFSDRPMFAELVTTPGPKVSHVVLWKGWKYIRRHQLDIDKQWEMLFHLAEDPLEQENLVRSQEPDHLKALAQLRKLIDGYIQDNARLAAELGEADVEVVTDEEREQLEQLGY